MTGQPTGLLTIETTAEEVEPPDDVHNGTAAAAAPAEAAKTPGAYNLQINPLLFLSILHSLYIPLFDYVFAGAWLLPSNVMAVAVGAAAALGITHFMSENRAHCPNLFSIKLGARPQ